MNFKLKFHVRYFVGFLVAFFFLYGPLKFILGKYTFNVDFIIGLLLDSVLIALAMNLYIVLIHPIISKQVTVEEIKGYKFFMPDMVNLGIGESIIINQNDVFGDIKISRSTDDIFIIEGSKNYFKSKK